MSHKLFLLAAVVLTAVVLTGCCEGVDKNGNCSSNTQQPAPVQKTNDGTPIQIDKALQAVDKAVNAVAPAGDSLNKVVETKANQVIDAAKTQVGNSVGGQAVQTLQGMPVSCLNGQVWDGKKCK